MLKELINVLRVIRPHHLFKALVHPLQEIQAFTYHYRRVPEHDFVPFLAKLSKREKYKLELVYNDLKNHTSFLKTLNHQLATHSYGYGGQMSTVEASAIYALVRSIKPEKVVETGVADGATSAFILRALEDNRKGKLYSIDLPSERLPPGKAPGWIVSDDLRHRWDLRIGGSEDSLEPLLKELGRIDCFLHDSLHTYEHMIFEFRTTWPYLCPGGLFLSHDVGRNAAFFDFAKEVGMQWWDWRVYNVLGGFRKKLDSKQSGRAIE